jgi:hypothetical protein
MRNSLGVQVPFYELLPVTGSSVGWPLADQLIRTAVYGPVRTVVWEGSGREACPYPDRPREAICAVARRERQGVYASFARRIGAGMAVSLRYHPRP